MKQQVSRLSPHQNGKVSAVFTTVLSFIFFLPFFLVTVVSAPSEAKLPMLSMMVIMPVFYLIFGYIMVAISCALYNFMFKYIGGIEYEAVETRDAQDAQIGTSSVI